MMELATSLSSLGEITNIKAATDGCAWKVTEVPYYIV